MKKLILTLLASSTYSVIASVALPVFAQGQGIEPLKNAKLGIPETSTLLEYITKIVFTFLTLAGIAGVIFVIVAGVRYMSSMGNEGEAEKAKHAIMYAVAGLIIIGLAAVIANFVINAINQAGP